MTLSELRTLLTSHQQVDLDNYAGVSPSTSDLNTQINFAYHWICAQTKCRYKHAMAITLSNSTEEYDLHNSSICAEDVFDLTSVTINGVPLRNASGKIGLYGMAEFQQNNPSYMSYTDGTPTKAVFHGEQYLLLSPAPTTAIVNAGNNYVSGFTLPVALSDNADVPKIPTQYHPCIALVAAAFSSTPIVTEAEGWTRIQRYDAFCYQQLKALERMSASQYGRASSSRGSQNGWVDDLVS